MRFHTKNNIFPLNGGNIVIGDQQNQEGLSSGFGFVLTLDPILVFSHASGVVNFQLVRRSTKSVTVKKI